MRSTRALRLNPAEAECDSETACKLRTSEADEREQAGDGLRLFEGGRELLLHLFELLHQQHARARRVSL